MSWLLRSITATVLILAAERNPHRHVPLSWLVCVTAAYCFVLAVRQGSKVWAGIFLAVALSYSPVMTMPLPESVWAPAGFVVAVLLLLSLKPVVDPAAHVLRAKAVFFVGAWVLVAGYIGVEVYWFTRIAAFSVRCNGTVEEVFEEEREYNDGRSVAVVSVARYRFEVAGRAFRGHTTGPLGEWETGDEIAVEYDVGDPNRNRAAGDGERLGTLFLFAVVLAAFARWVWTEHVTVLRLWWSARGQKPSNSRLVV